MRIDYSKKTKKRGKPIYDIFTSAIDQSDVRYWFKVNYPDLSKEAHKKLRTKAKNKIISLSKEYKKLLDKGAKKLWGRNFKVTDYKVSCIARDEFPKALKDSLRKLCKEINKYQDIFYAHNKVLPPKEQITQP